MLLGSRSWLLWVVLEAPWGPPGESWNPGQIQVLLEMPLNVEQEGENPWLPLWVTY